MERNGEAFDHRKGSFLFALAGLLLSTGSVLLQEPLLSLSMIKDPDKISIFILVYAYLFLLNPLTFHLNMLSVLRHATTHAGAPEAPLSAFLMNRVARTVSFATLFLGTPLWIQAAVTEDSIGLATGAALLCLGLVTTLTSVFKKLLISSSHAGGGFVLALFPLCISIGFLIFFDPILSFSYTNQYEPLFQIALHYFLLFVIFFIFILGITQLILCMSSPAKGRKTAIEAENWVIIALSVAFATLLVGFYLKAFVAVTDTAPVG